MVSQHLKTDLISTPVEDFILQTRFNGELLNTSEVWTPYVTQTFGRCWQFYTTQQVGRPGMFAGLQMLIDLKQYDFVNTTQWSAALFFPSQKDTLYSLPQNSMKPAKPGKATFMELSMNHYKRERQAPVRISGRFYLPLSYSFVITTMTVSLICNPIRCPSFKIIHNSGHDVEVPLRNIPKLVAVPNA